MVTIREATPADALAIAHVHVDAWRTTYRGIVPDDFLRDLSYEGRGAMWAPLLSAPQAGIVFVAEDDGQAVGFASGGPEMSGDSIYKGELYAIYVLDAYHGQGIGRRLASAIARWLTARGMTSLLVWVAARNPARHFYEALGGKYLRTKQETIGGAAVEEIAYGWTDISKL